MGVYEDIMCLNVVEMRDLAKEYGIKSAWKYKKNDLAVKISKFRGSGKRAKELCFELHGGAPSIRRVDLATYTMSELRAFAAEINLEGRSKAKTKDALIDLIVSKRKYPAAKKQDIKPHGYARRKKVDVDSEQILKDIYRKVKPDAIALAMEIYNLTTVPPLKKINKPRFIQFGKRPKHEIKDVFLFTGDEGLTIGYVKNANFENMEEDIKRLIAVYIGTLVYLRLSLVKEEERAKSPEKDKKAFFFFREGKSVRSGERDIGESIGIVSKFNTETCSYDYEEAKESYPDRDDL